MASLMVYNPQAPALRAPQGGPALQRPDRDLRDTAEQRTITELAEGGMRLGMLAAREYADTEMTRVSGALQRYREQLAAERERYSQERQGENALDAGEHFARYSREAAQEYGKDFSGKFADVFQRQAAGLSLHFTESGRAYAQQQKDAWQNSVLEGDISSYMNDVDANYANPEYIRFRNAGLKERLAEMRPGLDLRARFAQLDQNTVERVLNGHLAAGDLSGAQQALGQYQGMLGESAPVYQQKLHLEQRRREAEAQAQAEEARLDGAESTADALWSKVDNGEMTPSQALQAIKDIPDPRLQDHVRSGFSRARTIATQMKKNAEDSGRYKAAEAFSNLGNDLQGQYQLLRQAQRKALHPDASYEDKAYAKALDAQYTFNTQYLDEGIRTGSDPGKYDELLRGIEGGAYQDERQLKSSEHWTAISPRGKSILLNSLEEGQKFITSEAATYYDALFSGMNGRPYGKDNTDKEAFLAWAQDQVKHSSRARESGYIQSLADTWFKKARIPHSGVVFDTTGTFGSLSRGKAKNQEALMDVPEADRDGILHMFNNNPEIKRSWLTKYGGDLNLAVSGAYTQNMLDQLGPRGR